MKEVNNKFYNKDYKPSKKASRLLTKRNRIIALEHHIDKLHTELRTAIGFCIKVEENNPFENDIHQLQNDAWYLRDKLESMLDEWVDTTKEEENILSQVLHERKNQN